MAALKAVPNEPIDLAEFVTKSGPSPTRRWKQVIEALPPVDETKLRAALLEPAIAPNAITIWLEARGLIVDARTVKGWRRHNFAVTE